ncbi:FRG domain-containing protein [Treponema sp. R80B11-R83G3]
MGNKKERHKQKVAARNARLANDRKNIYFPNFTQVLNVSIHEGCYLMTWEHLIPILNIPSPNADVSVWNLVNRTRDGKALNGSYVKTAEDKFKIFLNPTGFSSYIYRGEHKEYEHFEPSLQRALRKNETDKIQTTKHFISALKKSPIYDYFKQPIKWGEENLIFDIDAEAIAQHYGFVSNYLDLTRNEDIAKFFAYTYVDEKTNEYKLIEDFEQYSPTLYRAHITDIYKRYGCEPIGFQPFLRPIKQWALAVNLGENYKGAKELFETYKLTDVKEAKRIYDSFKGGKLLFPKEPMTNFIDNSSPKFLDTLNWNTDYVKFLLNWLIENIGWRVESPDIDEDID